MFIEKGKGKVESIILSILNEKPSGALKRSLLILVST